MASSNRHWPSMYRSNLACNFQQPQPDTNNGGGGDKSSLMPSRCEESGRNPEPRPRWNPRPEQIRILEGIFNSGMVNPPRDEIRRIRLQLQEYGPVGDANVFYWFQNRKSRTKHKLRAAGQLQPSGRAALARACASVSPAPSPVTPPRHLLAAPVAPTSSSSSSSDRSSGSSRSVKPAGSLASPAAAIQGVLTATSMDMLMPTPGLAARQLYYHSQFMAPSAPPLPEMITSPEPLLLQWQQGQYLQATELCGILDAHTHAPAMQPAVSPSMLLGLCNEALGQDCIDMNCSKGLGLGQYWNNTCGTELSNNKTDAVSAVIRDDEKARLGLLHYGLGVTTTTTAAAAATSSVPLAAPVHSAVAAADASTAMLPIATPSNVAATTSAVLTDQLQALLDGGLMGGTAPPTATVVAVARDAVMCASTVQFSVPAMRLDVKLAFGEAAVLLRHTGEQVLVDDSGVTVEPLQQDALYYVLDPNDQMPENKIDVSGDEERQESARG
ncbi:WUSCHEL-related homeobox 12-like [Phragmites australis]|uniref:WUSCHEL-related homeobox 12-like n=1 Tax=Phragmites australis TaxID=29695 RepID=UPI002D76525A|nr:WUSCHEL-related homeobox 12-like [Phragmites australis]